MKSLRKLIKKYKYLILGLVIVLAGTVLIYGQKSNSATLNSSGCPDFNSINNQIKSDWGSKENGQISNGFGSVALKLSAGEPYLNYKTTSGLSAGFSNTELSQVDTYINNKLLSEIQRNGYELDQLNTGVPPWSFSKQYPVKSYSYKKGSNFLVISVGNDTSLGDSVASSVSLIFDCGTVDENYSSLYSQLLTTPSVTKLLANYAANFNDSTLSKIELNIFKIHQNNILEISWGYAGESGGQGAFVQKRNGEWQVVYQSQQTPECAPLESAGIEPGIDCIDPSGQFTKTK